MFFHWSKFWFDNRKPLKYGACFLPQRMNHIQKKEKPCPTPEQCRWGGVTDNICLTCGYSEGLDDCDNRNKIREK